MPTLNTSGPISLAGPTTGQSIAIQLGQGATTQISLNDTAVRTLAGIASGAITMPTNFWGKGSSATTKGIFGYGFGNIVSSPQVNYSITNLVSNTGVVSGDTAGVGTARTGIAACSYGGDKGIFGYGTVMTVGRPFTYVNQNITNLVSNTGVVSGNTGGVGTARCYLAACGYGGDKGIFGYGGTRFDSSGSPYSMTNLVSNTGVVSSDTTGVGTARLSLSACSYGGDKGIFGYGCNVDATTFYSMTNLVSNTGVVSGNTTGVGTARNAVASCGYGGDKGIFGYGVGGGSVVSMTNLVSNTGVVASDTGGVGTARGYLAACGYGGDKGIFGYGVGGGSVVSMTNLVSNTGVVASDTGGVGTARQQLGACGYSTS